ncbi:MAG: NTP transferase domain-containing protein [Verrucomicrobia bacterium]|nr:NTP transferase domain-containing protein [Verrucomicrobiota bacterium]
MQAVILAGGRGERLRPLTDNIPKPMVPIRGRPYLAHQLDELKRQGIDDVVLLTGYLGETIESFFGDGAALGMRVRYSREPSPLGTGGALKLAEPLLAGELVLIYGDSYLPVRYAEPLARLRASGAEALVVAFDNSKATVDVPNNLALDAAGFVTRYAKGAGAAAGLTHVEAGVLALARRVLGRIPAGCVCSLEQEIFPQLIAERGLAAWTTTQRFYDIGTPRRLKEIEKVLR